MIFRLSIFLLSLVHTCTAQNWQTMQVATLPEPVSNNAVCEGFTPTGNYLYSFAGIDSTLEYSGIHLKSWRVNTQTLQIDVLPDLPDTLGKVAAGANRVGNIIYIIGGYHVFANGNEVSSNKVHRFDVSQNQFIADGAPVPVPIDDHVQCVYKDSLIFVVTGWSNTGNVTNVQIYNTYTDSWQAGTPVPNNNSYRCFGASGQIIADTLYYYGGAAGFNFNGQSRLRKGYINPANPAQIDWFVEAVATPNYRSAAVTTHGVLHWLGGSLVTYNYDAIAYNGSGLVSPSSEAYFYVPTTGNWGTESTADLPMDLRGVAKISETEMFITGGIGNGAEVSDAVYRLQYVGTLDNSETFGEDLIPIKAKGNMLHVLKPGRLSVLGVDARIEYRSAVSGTETIDMTQFGTGIHIVSFTDSDNHSFQLKTPVIW